ncbi:hypothetical protein HPP92_003026 [Vanilla planifolia]|uniref:Uncharacterized protein n=1 Tax=Vanilla planifolia TaxID=51239 RepID=A0A835S2I8_VANPL|nr:hypothetical protein HPP92_003026 [Vanilla planifolia]
MMKNVSDKKNSWLLVLKLRAGNLEIRRGTSTITCRGLEKASSFSCHMLSIVPSMLFAVPILYMTNAFGDKEVRHEIFRDAVNLICSFFQCINLYYSDMIALACAGS